MIAKARSRLIKAPVSPVALIISTTKPYGPATLLDFIFELAVFTISMMIGIGGPSSGGSSDMSLVVKKTFFFCICENKDADQLRDNREADQRLCLRHTDSTIPLLPTSEISSLKPPSVVVQPGLCRTRSETPKTGFLTTRLICVQGPTLIRRCGASRSAQATHFVSPLY